MHNDLIELRVGWYTTHDTKWIRVSGTEESLYEYAMRKHYRKTNTTLVWYKVANGIGYVSRFKLKGE